MISISIIIPVFNMGNFLQSAIESVIAQIRSDCEIIIINDGSTDDTQETIERLRLMYGGVIRVLVQPNLGLATARNNGIDIAKGKYIIPLDADNKLADGYFTKGLSLLESDNNIHIVYGDYESFGEKSAYVTQRSFDITGISLKNYIDACAIFRKEVWDTLGGYDAKMPVMGNEDWEFWIHAYLMGYRLQHINTLCFYYRVRSSSMLRSVTNNRLIENHEYIFRKHGVKLFPQMLNNYSILKNENLHLKRRLEWYEKGKFKGAIKLLFKS